MNDTDDCHRGAGGGPAPATSSMTQWRKNQLAVTVSASFVFFGFTLVMPFLPIYVRQLGVEGTGAIAFWTGLILAVSPAAAALSGPLWGRLGDRFGLRPMTARATGVNCVCWFLMGFADSVLALFLLRLLLGLFGGFNSISVAAITQLTPQKRIARVIGTLQSTQILAAAIGPLVGGFLAQFIGIRNTFFATAVLMLGSFLTIILLYRDPPKPARTPEAKPDSDPRLTSSFFKRPEYLLPLLILFFIHMTDRTYAPVVPLFLEQLGTPTSRVAALSGTIFSLAALGEAFSAWLSGRLASRIRLGRLIMARLTLGILVLGPLVFVGSTAAFFTLRVLLALVAGGILTLAYTSAGSVIPGERRGTGFSILASTSLFGGSAGPIISGLLAGISIRAVFIFNLAVYMVLIAVVYRLNDRRPQS